LCLFGIAGIGTCFGNSGFGASLAGSLVTSCFGFSAAAAFLMNQTCFGAFTLGFGTVVAANIYQNAFTFG